MTELGCLSLSHFPCVPRCPPALVVSLLISIGLKKEFVYAIPTPTVNVPERLVARMGSCVRAYCATDAERKKAQLNDVAIGKIVYRGVSDQIKFVNSGASMDGERTVVWNSDKPPGLLVAIVLSSEDGYDVRYASLADAIAIGFDVTKDIIRGTELYNTILSRWSNLATDIVAKFNENPFNYKSVVIDMASAQRCLFVFQAYMG